MISHSPKKAVLSVLIATLLGGVVVADAFAQARSSDRNERRSKGSAKAEVLFPEATRTEPNGKPSSKMGGKLQKLFAAYNKDDYAQTRTLADEIIASADANDYDKAVANQLASQAAYNLDDGAATKQYLQPLPGDVDAGPAAAAGRAVRRGAGHSGQVLCRVQVGQAGRTGHQGPGAVPD
jgi:NADH dehydrogenase/NADH:ubiquinone oxidoreductase subunit G